MTAVEELVEDLADLYEAQKTAGGSARAHIQRVQDRRVRAASGGIAKAPTARLLGISVNTLDKWIARGRIKTILSPGSVRAGVDATQVAQLLTVVRVLREQGRRTGVLAAAIQQLEREDDGYQREFAELYGPSLASMGAGNVKPLELPDTFGPEDWGLSPRFGGPWDIYQPPELDPQLDALAGQRAGLRHCLDLLSRDPCHPGVDGYRLSGPLAPIVWGAHLSRGYRIAYSTQPALTESDRPRVVVLYVGKREPGHQRNGDIWEVLHDLFDADNPVVGHTKPPCCERDLPEIDYDALSAFLQALRRVNRGR
jgi:hypothetical protein